LAFSAPEGFIFARISGILVCHYYHAVKRYEGPFYNGVGLVYQEGILAEFASPPFNRLLTAALLTAANGESASRQYDHKFFCGQFSLLSGRSIRAYQLSSCYINIVKMRQYVKLGRV